MQQMKSKGFQCKADRERDAAIEKRYGKIGIKSVQAAQTLCNKSKFSEFTKPASEKTTAKPH